MKIIRKLLYFLTFIIVMMTSCAPSYYVIGNVTHRNGSGELLNSYANAIIATQNYDYGNLMYVESKSFIGNGFFFNDCSGERKFINGGIIQIDSIRLVKIDEYDKSREKKDLSGNTIPSEAAALVSEYNNNERIIKDLSALKREAERSKTGNEQYIADVKERLRMLKNRQATIERILYREYGTYIRTTL